MITPHPVYIALGALPAERHAAYERWLREGVCESDMLTIRQHMAQERVLGDERFQRMVEATLQRPVSCRPRGRPRKDETERDQLPPSPLIRIWSRMRALCFMDQKIVL